MSAITIIKKVLLPLVVCKSTLCTALSPGMGGKEMVMGWGEEWRWIMGEGTLLGLAQVCSVCLI